MTDGSIRYLYINRIMLQEKEKEMYVTCVNFEEQNINWKEVIEKRKTF